MIRVVDLRGLALVQDLGRPGHMHEGLARGGALVPCLLASANAALGNPANAAAIELYGEITLEAERELTVATEDGALHVLHPGHRQRIPSRPDLRVRYVALPGGIDTPMILGSRSALLVANLGRVLRKSDRIATATATATSTATSTSTSTSTSTPTPTPTPTPTSIRVVPGPDLARFTPEALATLFSSEFQIASRSDRIGTRLEGPALARFDRDDARSAPMARGAIEVPASGEPIVLGPDHPTTGGYPILGVIASADQDAFFARPLGARVRFCEK